MIILISTDSSCGPKWKRIPARFTETGDQRADDRPARIQLFDNPVQSRLVLLIPFGWNTGRDTPNGINIHFFGAGEGRLECFPIPHVLINTVSRIDTPERRVWEAPFARVKAIALINEHGPISTLLRLTIENRLPSIGVARPLVEHQHARKIVEVGDLG